MSVPALQIEGLGKVYRNGPEALSGVDIEVAEGEFFALLGPNGAGKSTTIGIITSLINKTAGRVRVFGHDLDQAPALAKACIGLVPQEFNFNQFEPVQEIVANQAGYYGTPPAEARRRAGEILRQLELWDKRTAQARDLSGGMKRRLMIARALANRPRLLILDEPTAGVDIEIRRAMWDFLREINRQGTTIILTTHYLEEAESLCREIAIIDHGRIIEHAAMADLLRRLQTETFILDLHEPLQAPPALGDFVVRQLDARTLEVGVCRGQDLNRLFAELSAAGIRIDSLRNKTNRLEQLFLDLIGASPDAEACP